MDRRLRRIRESQHEMAPVKTAVQRVLDACAPLPTVDVSAADAVGMVVATPVHSVDPVPPFRASIVDGYAVASSDGPGKYPIVGTMTAGTAPDAATVKPGTVAYVTTGGALPPGADAAVKVEDTEGEFGDGGEEVAVTIKAQAAAGQWVREVGSDIAAGAPVMDVGEPVTAAEVGLLCTVGATRVSVYRRPRVGVLSTGNELVDASSTEPVPPGAIRDSNRPMLLAAVTSVGGEPVDLGIINDDYDATKSRMLDALADVDVLVTSGGVSMGDHDFVKPILQEVAHVQFGRLLMKPGKPAVFATLPPSGDTTSPTNQNRLVFALPGNPVSSLVTFHLLVAPAIRRLLGHPPVACTLPTTRCRLVVPARLDPERPEYHRVVVYRDGGHLVALSTGVQRSSRLLSSRGANGLVCVPQGDGVMAAGSEVDVMLFAPLVAKPPARLLAAVKSGSGGSGASAGAGHHHHHHHHHGHGHGRHHHHHSHGEGHTHSEAAKPSSAAGPTGCASHVGQPPFRGAVCVLTVSDRCSRGESEDRSGPLAVQLLRAVPGLDITELHTAVVPDEADLIRGKLLEWAHASPPAVAIFTTGGTGFAKRDVTPEATAAVLDRKAPGLSQAIMAAGLAKFPAAMLSRGVCGVVADTLVVNMPGSTGGVRDAVSTLAPILPHMLRQIAGSPADAHPVPKPASS